MAFRSDFSNFQPILKTSLEIIQKLLLVCSLHNSLVCIEFWHKLLAMNIPKSLNFDLFHLFAVSCCVQSFLFPFIFPLIPLLLFVPPLFGIMLYSFFSFAHSFSPSFLVQQICQLLNSFSSIPGILSEKKQEFKTVKKEGEGSNLWGMNLSFAKNLKNG